MSQESYVQIAVTVGSMLAVMVPALFQLGAKFQGVRGELAGLRLQISGIEKDLQEVKDGLTQARSARAELWVELNNLRDRTTRLSTVVTMKEAACPTK